MKQPAEAGAKRVGVFLSLCLSKPLSRFLAHSISAFLNQRLFHLFASAGDLPVPVVQLVSGMNIAGRFAYLGDSGPGFTLPATLGALDPTVTTLNLSWCNLIGKV